MIHFVWPWLAVVLPLPWLLRRYLPAALNSQDAALRVPFLDDFNEDTVADQQFTSRRLILYAATLAWVFLVMATMRPQWLGDLVEIPISGRDLMLAVDLSGSMKVQDFILKGKQVDRLTATKSVASNFIERRLGDRLGLILFGEQAYLQVPLTFDRTTVEILLSESFIGLAGEKTAIGDAIGLAVKRLRDQDKNSRVLILLTDGANTAGAVEPINAAELAAREGIKIYTIGIGADEMIVKNFFGQRRFNPSADLDEDTLTDIATKTGGRYFRARDTAELADIYDLLDELEPLERETQKYRPRKALYYWPLFIALCISLIILTTKIAPWKKWSTDKK